MEGIAACGLARDIRAGRSRWLGRRTPHLQQRFAKLTLIPYIRSALEYRRQNAVSLGTVLVVDVEATTGADRPRGALRDVIQVGACVLQMDGGAIVDAQSILVQPSCSEVTAFCTRLTGITPEQAAEGVAFVDACAWLQNAFNSSDLVWASFGDFDREQFATQCAREGVAYPFGRGHLNIKTIVALRYGWHRGKGLTRALSTLGIRHTGRHHDAKDDAVNAARLFHRALRG